MILGLDYDDTITAYRAGLKVLVEGCTELHVITLNNRVSGKHIHQLLGKWAEVHIMEDHEFDTAAEDVGVGKWKANKCKELGVDIMIDDLQSVCDACTAIGIPSIQVHLKD